MGYSHRYVSFHDTGRLVVGVPLRVERVWSTCRNRIRVARVVGIGDIKVKSETLAQSLAAPPPFLVGRNVPPLFVGVSWQKPPSLEQQSAVAG